MGSEMCIRDSITITSQPRHATTPCADTWDRCGDFQIFSTTLAQLANSCGLMDEAPSPKDEIAGSTGSLRCGSDWSRAHSPYSHIRTHTHSHAHTHTHIHTYTHTDIHTYTHTHIHTYTHTHIHTYTPVSYTHLTLPTIYSV